MGSIPAASPKRDRPAASTSPSGADFPPKLPPCPRVGVTQPSPAPGRTQHHPQHSDPPALEIKNYRVLGGGHTPAIGVQDPRYSHSSGRGEQGSPLPGGGGDTGRDPGPGRQLPARGGGCTNMAGARPAARDKHPALPRPATFLTRPQEVVCSKKRGGCQASHRHQHPQFCWGRIAHTGAAQSQACQSP